VNGSQRQRAWRQPANVPARRVVSPAVYRRRRIVTAACALTLVALAVGVPIWATGGNHPVGSDQAARARGATRPAGAGAIDADKRAVVPGPKPVFSWPKVGEAAVAVRGVGPVGRSPRQRPVPIASLTKMMTALVVLHDHPLVPGESGPRVRVIPADVATWEAEAVAGDSTVKVVAGETLSEYQLLEALLVPSGDNIADVLATWDAGSVRRFVEKMNTMAEAIGLASTHYADASGLNAASTSTAADQARLAADLMGNTVIRAIVRIRHLAFPVAKSLWNANPALGTDGIIGVKSGWTLAANGCLVAAAFRTVRHHGVLVVSVVLGQPGGLWNAAVVDEDLLNVTTSALVAYRVARAGAKVATLALPKDAGDVVLVAPRQPSFAAAWRGLKLTERISEDSGLSLSALATERVGSVVAEMRVVAPWGVIARFPLRLDLVRETPSRPTGSVE